MRVLGKLSIFVTVLTIVSLSTCGSKAVVKETKTVKKIEIKKITDEKKAQKIDYGSFLVDVNRYTTNGAIYHKKYYNYLIEIAKIFIKKRKLDIAKGSIGFYYDRKSEFKNRLYLGIDIITGIHDSNPYYEVALDLLKRYMAHISETIARFDIILREREIIGLVVGLRWKNNYREEQVNIWVSESDLYKYNKKLLTFDELIQKCTITNTFGNIIKLPI